MKYTLLIFISFLLWNCSNESNNSDGINGINGVWAEYRGSHERTGFSQSSAPSAMPTDITNEGDFYFDFEFTAGFGPDGSPIIANGKLYMLFTDWQGYDSLGAYDLNNGSEIWSYSLENSIMPPAVSDGILYFAGNDAVVALDANNGSEIWKTTVSINIDSSPTVYNGIILVSNLAINSNTGEVLWQFDSSLNANPDSVYSYADSYGPTVYNDLVYYSGYESFANYQYQQNEYIYAVNINTGKEVWRQQIDNREWSRTSIIPVTNNILYFTTNDGIGYYRYALNASTGEIVWKIEGDSYTEQESCPAVAYGKVFINTFNGLFAFDRDTGQEIWKFGGNGITRSSYTPVVADNKVFLIGEDYFYALDANNGNEIWKYDGVYGGGLWDMEPVVISGRIYYNDGIGITILK